MNRAIISLQSSCSRWAVVLAPLLTATSRPAVGAIRGLSSKPCDAAPGAVKHTGSSKNTLSEGSRFSVSKTFTEQEVRAFLSSTGDGNPIHVDSAAAAARGLSAPVLPGILLASLFPAIIGTCFPGALYATQSLAFRAPAAVGQQVEAEVTVKRRSGSRVTFATICRLPGSGQVLVDGTAMAMLPTAAPPPPPRDAAAVQPFHPEPP